MKSLVEKIKNFGSFVRFSHTIFALPFALTSVALSSYTAPVTWNKILWILLALVGARSAAMGFNRIHDSEIDALNPRTSDREIPQGKITLPQAWIFVSCSGALLVFSAYMLNILCFILSPLALVIVFFYSFTKRFTWLTHLFLGLSLGIAPVGAWIAITGSLSLPPVILSGAVILWVAGFDIIYATMDVRFDRSLELKSIPSNFGITTALRTSALMHIITVLLLGALYFLFPLDYLYPAGIIFIASLLIYEHSIVSPSDLSRVNKAFFDLNGYVSVAFFVFTLFDVMLESY